MESQSTLQSVGRSQEMIGLLDKVFKIRVEIFHKHSANQNSERAKNIRIMIKAVKSRRYFPENTLLSYLDQLVFQEELQNHGLELADCTQILYPDALYPYNFQLPAHHCLCL